MLGNLEKFNKANSMKGKWKAQVKTGSLARESAFIRSLLCSPLLCNRMLMTIATTRVAIYSHFMPGSHCVNSHWKYKSLWCTRLDHMKIVKKFQVEHSVYRQFTGSLIVIDREPAGSSDFLTSKWRRSIDTPIRTRTHHHSFGQFT